MQHCQTFSYWDFSKVGRWIAHLEYSKKKNQFGTWYDVALLSST